MSIHPGSIFVQLFSTFFMSMQRKEHIESSVRIKRFARKLFDGRDTTLQFCLQSQTNANFCSSPYFLSHAFAFADVSRKKKTNKQTTNKPKH